MRLTKIQSVSVTGCYVSSSGHYNFDLVLTRTNGETSTRYTWGWNMGLESLNSQGTITIPAYLTRMIKLAVAHAVIGGKVRYREYDQEGNARYADLRYYDAKYIRSHAMQVIRSYAEQEAE
jgi:anti-sigma factor ChrR (cupin superfamily)